MELNFQTMFQNAGVGVGEIDEMKKSLEAGAPTPYTGSTGGGALLAQDLSADLTMQTLQAEDVKLFKSLYVPAQKAKSVAFEYRRQNALGPQGPMSQWQAEGVIGAARDATFEMLYTRCKFMSQIRQATMTMINTGMFTVPGDVVAKMTMDASLEHGHLMEGSLFNGDDSVDSQSILGLKGVARVDGTIKDMRGADLDIDTISQYAVEMYEGAALGKPNQFYCPMAVRRQLGFEMGDRVRSQQNVGQSPAYQGGAILDERGLLTDVGSIPAIGTRFLAPQRGKNTSATSIGQTPPATPALTSVTPGAVAPGETSNFIAADAGTYYYRVAAVGPRGVAFVTSTVQTVAAGEKVTITMTAPVADDTRFYVVFRTRIGGLTTEFWPIQSKAQTFASPGVPDPTVITDLNDDLPGKADCYLIENTPQAMCWRDHTPFSRIVLPIPANTLIQPYGFIQFGAFLTMKKYIVRRFKNVNVPTL